MSILKLTRTLDSEIVLEIIKLADQARNTERMVFQKLMKGQTDASFDNSELSEANPKPKNLVDYLSSLSDEQVIEVTALMWLGRGDYAATTVRDAYTDAIEQARRSFKRDDVGYLADKPLKAYLLKAIELDQDGVL